MTTVSPLQMRLAQALPTLFSLALTACVPWAAKRSLQLWRAVQVYDAQQPATQNDRFTYREPTKVSKRRMALSAAWPIVLYGLFYASAGYDFDAAGWPIVGALRHSFPFALLALCVFLTQIVVIASSLTPVSRVSRLLKVKERTASALQITRCVVPDHTKTRRSNAIVGWSKVAALAVSSVTLAYVCARAQSSLFVITLMALCSMAMSFHAITLPVTMFKKTSLRAHIYTIVAMLAFTCALLAVFAALILTIIFLDGKFGLKTVKHPGDKDEVKQPSSPKGFAAIDIDLPVNQFVSLIYTLFWYAAIFLPCALITLAYRFDVSQAGWTTVAEQDAQQSLVESRLFSEQLQEQRLRLAKPGTESEIELHPFDHLGRIPVRIDAPSLFIRSPSSARPQTPTFNATLRTLIAFQLIGLVLNVVLLPADVNTPYFPFVQGDLTGSPPITSNIWPLLAYPVLMLVMPVSVAWSSRRRGEAVGVGLRRLWKYEECWGAEYKQAPVCDGEATARSDLTANEEAKPLLCDVDEQEA